MIQKFVCEECGSTNVEITAWVDANTNEYVSDSDDSEWCSECEAHNTLITLKEFKEQMLSWWESCESKVMEQITDFGNVIIPLKRVRRLLSMLQPNGGADRIMNANDKFTKNTS